MQASLKEAMLKNALSPVARRLQKNGIRIPNDGAAAWRRACARTPLGADHVIRGFRRPLQHTGMNVRARRRALRGRVMRVQTHDPSSQK
jgi:hypothetical protein